MKESFMNELTRIDETEWSKGVLVLDNWVKLWEAHLCFDLYVDLSFISEREVFLDRILIWIIDLGTLLVLDRFRVTLSWMIWMKIG